MHCKNPAFSAFPGRAPRFNYMERTAVLMEMTATRQAGSVWNAATAACRFTALTLPSIRTTLQVPHDSSFAWMASMTSWWYANTNTLLPA